ncbi:MAG: UbiD family decarboxylase domain-containing protein, partial [Janthinobacterium lividum]
MSFNDLPEFLKFLESKGQLKKITYPVNSYLEITEISRRVLATNGPALLFENVINKNGLKSSFPVVTNLYASLDRILIGLGLQSKEELRDLGELLAFLRQPKLPRSVGEAFSVLSHFKRILAMSPKKVSKAPCQQIVMGDPDLSILPIQTCCPSDVSPLITWPLIVTKGPTNGEIDNYNLG